MHPGDRKVSHRDSLSCSHFPVHNIQAHKLHEKAQQSGFKHFHAPYNSHTRFLSSATAADKHFLRDFQRKRPYRARRPHPLQADGTQDDADSCAGSNDTKGTLHLAA